MLAKLKFWDHSADTKSDNWIFGTMLGFGLLGLIASFVLTLDKFRVLENPHAQLSCSVNLVINCSTVMQTAQASLFGFPNSLLGVMLFPLVIFIAVLGLMRLKLPNLFWGIVNIGFLLGTIFSYWLFFQSVYVIQVLCPWCLLVTLTMTILLSTIFQHNLRGDIFAFSKSANKKAHQFIKKDYLKLITISWIIVLVVLVFVKFGDSLFLS